MKTIDNKIVFSNDIKRILEGKNSLNFDYQKNGIQIPNNIIFENLRKNFQKETKEIFNNQVEIISEEEMRECIEHSIKTYLFQYPHCIFR